MDILNFSNSTLSILPPAVALILAIVTRQVLISLGVGIILGAILLTDYSFSGSLMYTLTKVSDVFIEDGGINTWNMSIVAFLILLGMMTALLTLSGGTNAFAQWAKVRVKNKRGSKLLAAFLGVFIFVDDYFNSLAVGSIARPVTDRFYVSRAKLAYILDSTAAPMCVVMPVSSWGAYIMTIISAILIKHGITDYSPLGAYLLLVPMNFYAVLALIMVFVVAYFQMDIGPMRRHEILASQARGFDVNQEELPQEVQQLNEELDIVGSDKGRVSDLIYPIVFLILCTIGSMVLTGWQSLAEQGKAFDIFGAFENTNVGASLVYGGTAGLVMALWTVLRQKLAFSAIGFTLWVGAKSMFAAILILVFAWTIGTVIGDMQTGAYLSSLVQGNIDPVWLPVILFVLSSIMAFSTGTSWGTFGIMLPIAGDMAAATEITLMLPMLGAVLAGAVFGDHCSPISDTTILSSTGARCHHMDHVATQLPYALVVAAITIIGFIVLGVTSSIWLAWLITVVVFVAVCAFMIQLSKRKLSQA